MQIWIISLVYEIFMPPIIYEGIILILFIYHYFRMQYVSVSYVTSISMQKYQTWKMAYIKLYFKNKDALRINAVTLIVYYIPHWTILFHNLVMVYFSMLPHPINTKYWFSPHIQYKWHSYTKCKKYLITNLHMRDIVLILIMWWMIITRELKCYTKEFIIYLAYFFFNFILVSRHLYSSAIYFYLMQ